MRTLRPCLLLLTLIATGAARLHAQQPWSTIDSPTSRPLWGIAYGSAPGVPGRFVAVGEGGTIATSSDGLAWTARESGTSQWLLGVTWSPTLKVFVVVGDGGTILTSSDGIAWTPRDSGTTQRLNSVAWNSKRFSFPDVFVAVGENGTALVSYDLATWTRRETGDNGWLRGIAAGTTDVFIVTGHDGTILTTEDAGETWHRRSSGTTLHLDAVAYRGNARFSVTGSNFVLAHTSDSGRTWTLDRNVNTDGRENGVTYNGLVWFNEALVAVGDQGRIVDEAGRRWATSDPLFAGWRAVAASPDRVVAVGTDGSIASAPRDPHLSLEHDISASFLADSILLTATRRYENRSLGFTIQWSVNGEPIAGANDFTLRLNTTTGAQNGTYTFTATAPDGETFSTSITLDPRPNPAALGLVDTDFRPQLSAPPGPIVPLPDGRVIVAGRDAKLALGDRLLNGPVRLLPDGSLDPAFAVRDGVLVGSPQALLLQPDGRLLVVERIAGLAPSYRAIRLNTDGSADTTFRPDPLLVADGDPPIPLADGRWLAVERQTSGVGYSVPFTAVLRRFHSDGSVDSSFAPRELMTGTTGVYADGRAYYVSGPRAIGTRDTQGRIYLGVQHADFAYSQAASGGATRLFRLNADATVDPSFAPRDVGPLTALSATTQGLLARTTLQTWGRMAPSRTDTALLRLKFDGTPDPTYQARTARTEFRTAGPRSQSGLSHDFDVLRVAPDESILVRTVGHLGHFGLVRLDASGELDRDFNAELGSEAIAVTQVHALPSGKILVAGTFRSLLGIMQPYLARLVPNTRAAATHLGNVSVRARVDAATGPLIAGYVTRGGNTGILARGAGPALAQFGVATPLADPRLGLFSRAEEISSNDDWETGGAELLVSTAARLGAFPFAARSADAALHTIAPAGAFTVLVAPKGDAGGVALAEIYHAGTRPADATGARVTNFSVRTTAGTGGDTLIAGFTLYGDNTRNLVIRAVGPALARFGIGDHLPDPVLTVFRGETVVATNDNWGDNLQSWLVLLEAFATVGAFPLQEPPLINNAASGRDAAMLISLAPGSYTIHVSGKSGATGVALVEIYEVP